MLGTIIILPSGKKFDFTRFVFSRPGFYWNDAHQQTPCVYIALDGSPEQLILIGDDITHFDALFTTPNLPQMASKALAS